MPFIQEHGLELLIVIFFINSFVAYGDSIFNIPLRTPFDASLTVHAAPFPQALNETGNSNNLLANETNNVGNSTNTNPFIRAVQANVFAFFQWAYPFIAFISGGFIWSAVSSISTGFPPFLIAVFDGAIVIFMARTAYYYVRGV